MEQGPAPRSNGESQPSLDPAAEHPEAHGFGQRRSRLRVELAVIAALLVALPFGVVSGARSLAARMALELPPSMDEALGRPTWEALQHSGERCRSAEGEAYLKRLADPLVTQLRDSPFQFRFLLASSGDVNAFALPGGFVVVNAGLLREAQSGDEIAAVLAHELSHVTLRHSTQRLAASLGAGAALAMVFGFIDLGAPAYTVSHLAGLRYERDQESEADRAGRALLRGAGISPLAMAVFFERIGSMARPPEILSTHPDPGDRAERARLDAEGFQPRSSLPPPPGFSCE
jgi:predicted Zn-dependent protease